MQLSLFLFQMSQKLASIAAVALVICTLLPLVTAYRKQWKRQTVTECYNCCQTCLDECWQNDLLVTDADDFQANCFVPFGTCESDCANSVPCDREVCWQ